MSILGATGLFAAVALASAASGRLIVAVLPLVRLRRCDAMGVAATTVLGTIVLMLAAARLSELGLTEPRILGVLLAGHGVLAALAVYRRGARCFHPVGPVAGWATLLVLLLFTSVTALLPLILTGGFGLGFDSFIYCSAGEWLHDHPFSEVAESSPVAPIAGVVAGWQQDAVALGASHALALFRTAGAGSALVAYPLASSWAVVLVALSVVLAARWALRLPLSWAWSAGFVFALLPNPALWSHHNGFFAQTYGAPGLVFGLAAMGLPTHRRDRSPSVLVGLAAAYLLTVYIPFLPLLGAAAAVWLLGGLQLGNRRTAGRVMPAIAAIFVYLVAGGLELRFYRLLPSLVAAKVGGPVVWSGSEWLTFAMGTRPYVVGHAPADLSPTFLLIAAVVAAALAAAGAADAALRRSAQGLLAATVVVGGLVLWQALFVGDPWTGRTGHTWSVFKAVKWAYPLVLLLQAAGAARACRLLGRAGAAFGLAVVLILASAQLSWARDVGMTLRRAVLTESPWRDAATIKNRFRALPAGRVVLLGRPANLSPWLGIYTALFAYPRPISLDWEDSPIRPDATGAVYRSDLKRLMDPGLVFVATGVEGLSDAPVEPLGGPYVWLLRPDRPQLVQVVTPRGVERDLVTRRPYLRLGPDRTKFMLIAAKPCMARIALGPRGPSPLPLRAAIQVIPDVLGGWPFHVAIRTAPVTEVMSPRGAALEFDAALVGGQTALNVELRPTPGTAAVARIDWVSVCSGSCHR